MGMLENQWRSDQRNQATFPRAWCIRLNCHRCYEIYVYMGLCKDSQLQGANTENFRGKAEPAKWYAPAATMPILAALNVSPFTSSHDDDDDELLLF